MKKPITIVLTLTMLAALGASLFASRRPAGNIPFQDRDEMNGVTVTGTVSAGEQSWMTDIEVVVKNNNGMTVKNVQFEVKYSCDSKTFTASKTISYLAAKDSTKRWIETCARMTSSGRPEARIISVRVINVD